MRSFKKGQVKLRGILKTFLSQVADKKDYEMILYALNSGKRIATILFASLSHWKCSNDSLLAIEFLHTSQVLISDMLTKQLTRRTKEAFYLKFGVCETYRMAAWFQHQALKRLHVMNEYIYKALSYEFFVSGTAETQREAYELNMKLCKAKSRLITAVFSMHEGVSPYAGELLGTLYYAVLKVEPKELVNTAQNYLTDLMYNFPSKHWPLEIKEMVQSILSKIKN